MFFVVRDDDVLCVVNSESELQGAFEGIDVEEGIYRFFDDTGAPLVPEFVKPNETGKLFGVFRWVSSGTYRLVPAGLGQRRSLNEVLDTVSGLERNSRFSNLQEVREFLTSRSRPTR